MKTRFDAPLVLMVLVIVVGLVAYFGFTRPEQKKCEDMGGEVVSVGNPSKGAWECEVPLNVVLDRAGL